MIIQETLNPDLHITESIHAMDASERPREKALKYGFGVLSVPELFALILRTGTKGYNIIEVCREMMRRNGNKMRILERRDLEEICDIKGIGENKAIQVMAVMELIRRYDREALPEMPVIRTSSDIWNLMLPILSHLPHEEIWAAFLNRRNKVTKLYQASRGGTSSSVFDVKLIMKAALMERAEGIVLTHNHPSGTLLPSSADDEVTRKLKDACSLFDIRFLDHLIITQSGYYSYSDQGRL